MTRAAWCRVAAATCLLLAAPVAQAAQKGEKKRPNDPTLCSVCQADPLLMEAGGIVAHGGFPFGKKGNDTEKTDKHLATLDIRWIETKNFRIGFALGSHKVKQDEKKKFVGELTKLKAAFPKVLPETGLLDPWLRLHLYAQRCEEIHARFLEIVDGRSATFPDGTGAWRGAYQGEGPFLGMKDKYEVLIVPNEAAHVDFLLENAGLRIRNTQRWHFVDRGAITVSMHAQQGNLRNDAGLHAHVAFNLAHNLYDGLNHYSYDTPIWLHEGLAHFMGREVDPRNNSFDGGEGAVADMTSKSNWKPEVMKLIAAGEAPRMAELMALKNFGELKLVHHFTTWSMVDFLVTTKPREFGAFLWAIKRNFDANGAPTGANLPDWHRRQFREVLGWSYAEFDQAWRDWVQVAYRPGVPKGGETLPTPPGGIPLGGGGGGG
ncbi:MAG: hypothetical protein JNK02_16070 [Planctomycetes bacterium]|nr:hypothetical protein [Planctomycetota bacterium]